MASLHIEPLPLNDDASDWFSRMEASRTILEASSGNSIDPKVYLIAVIGKEAIAVLKDLLSPRTIDSESYSDIKSVLLRHLIRQRLEIAERYSFYSVSQEEGENISVFYCRLKKAAEHCNFGSYLDDMLRDRLVLGCDSAEARRKLLQTDKLTLSKTLEVLRSFEAVGLARGEIRAPVHTVQSVPELRDIDHLSASSKRNSKVSSNTSRSCYRCGSKDYSSAHVCPALNQTCKNCGKRNHFARVCRSRAQHFVDVEPEANDCSNDIFHVQSLPANTSPSRVTIDISSKSIIMEIDTGAALTVLPESIWIELGSPALTPSNHIFSTYFGHRIRPLGKFSTTLSRDGQSIEAEITVARADRSFGLLGRDLIPRLAPEIDLPALMINTVEDNYLPAIKMQPVRIERLPDSVNKFCKSRPIPLAFEDKVKSELISLEKRGVIKPVSSSACASPVVWVKKNPVA